MRALTKIGCSILATGFVGLALVGSRASGADAPTTQPMVAPIFTEDFESGALNKEFWSERVSNGGTVTVQQEVAAHGKNALKVHYPAAARAYAFAVANKLPHLETVKDHVFGRAYVNFPVAPVPGHLAFINGGSEGYPVSNFMEIGNRQNKAQLSYQQNGKDITRGETMIPGPAYPVGKWFCLEWEFNDHPDTISIWIDGEKVLDDAKAGFKDVNEDLIKGFVEFGFGFRSFGNVPNGFDVYYDDIAIGATRIGPLK